MKKPFLFLLLLGLIALPTTAQTPPQPASTATTTARVNKLFEAWDKPTSPGCALAVMQDGQIIYRRGYGMANLDYDIPITTTTVFHVASVSKQFTAAAIALLAQQGKLLLDDSVRKYVPELPEFGDPITIRHLIHHTSGLRDQWTLLGLAGQRYSLDRIADADVLNLMARQKELNFRPGEKYLYCNTGYTLLAVIVARVSGQSFREFTDANLFRPLGMKHTHFRDNFDEIVKQQATGYIPFGNSFRVGATNFDTVGATSLLTTVEDLARWDQNFYEPKVGGPGFIAQMCERGKLNNGETINYAFALNRVNYRGLPVEEHGGADAGFRAYLMRFPEQRFSVAFTCNAGPIETSALARKIADIYLAGKFQDAPAKPTTTLTEAQLQSRIGLYLDAQSGDSLNVTLQDQQLVMQMAGSSFRLQPISENHFRMIERPGEVMFESGATPRLIRLDDVAGKSVYNFMPLFSLPASQLSAYAGDYASEEIEPVFRLQVQGDMLMLLRLKYRTTTLQPIARDIFLTGSGSLHFTRNAQQQVTGFVYNLGRVRNFRMTKKMPGTSPIRNESRQ
jgi:CubicO group peptidase (beta-lactamase class C family)